jgi:DNA-binding transcriptional LysR family regulator
MISPGMDVRHINAFVVVAEEGNFTKAARRLNVSQPPLSRLIRQLEVDLGVVLFSRSHRGAELTRHGRVLLEKARAVTEAANSFHRAAQTMTGTASRTIHLETAWGLWAAVDRIREHHARRVPDSRMAVSDLYSHADRHERGVPDVILQRGAADHSEYESSVLFTERLVAVLATTHPLASRARLALEDLATQQLLMCDRETDPGLYDGTRALVASVGFRQPVVHGQPPPYTPAGMMLLVSGRGFYVGSASPFTQTLHASGVAVVPIDEPGARIEIHLAWRRRERSEHLMEFLRSACEAFRLSVAGRRSSSASAFAV